MTTSRVVIFLLVAWMFGAPAYPEDIAQPPIYNDRVIDEELCYYAAQDSPCGQTCFCSPANNSLGWPCDACPGVVGPWPLFSSQFYVEASEFSCVPINFDDLPLLDLPEGFTAGEVALAPDYHISVAPIAMLNRIREVPLECSPDRVPADATARYAITLDGDDSTADCSGAVFFVTAEFDASLFEVRVYGRIRSGSSYGNGSVSLSAFKPRLIVGSEVSTSNILRYPPLIANPQYIRVGMKAGRSPRDAGNQSVRLRFHSYNWGGDDCLANCLEGVVFDQDAAKNVQVFSLEFPPDWCEQPPPLSPEDRLPVTSLPPDQQSAAEFDGSGAGRMNELTADLPTLKVGHCRFRTGRTLAEPLGNDAYWHSYPQGVNDFVRVNMFGVWCAVDDLPKWTWTQDGTELTVTDPNEGLTYHYQRPGGGALQNAALKLGVVKRSETALRTYSYAGGGVQGDLIEQLDSDGNAIEYSYDPNGEENTVTVVGSASAGGSITVVAGFSDCLTTCTLTSATWSNGGPSRGYEYGPDHITNLFDAAGKPLRSYTYDSQGRLTQKARGEGPDFEVQAQPTYFSTPGSGTELGSTCMVNQCFVKTVNDVPYYQATIYTFDEFNRIVERKEFHDLQTIEVVSSQCDSLPAFTGPSSTTTIVYRTGGGSVLGISGADLVIEEKLPSGSVSRYSAFDTPTSGQANLLRTFLAVPNLTTVNGATLINEKRYTYVTAGGISQVNEEFDVARDNAKLDFDYDSSTGFITKRTHPIITAANSGSSVAIPSQIETFTYDSVNNKLITAETRRNGANATISVTNTYDAYSYPATRTESVTSCDSMVTETEYDAFGRLVKQTDADGFVNVRVYELEGHPNDGSGLLLGQYTYESGESGPVLQETRYFYYTSGPDLGRLERVDIADHDGSFTIGSPSGWQRTTFEYDVFGRVDEKTTTHTSKPGTFTWQYFYDSQDRITQITYAGGMWVRTVRDGRGHGVNDLVGYGGSEGEGGTTVLTNTYAYDANGNLIERFNQTAADLPDHTIYEYDDYDRRIKKIDKDDGSVGYDIITSYEYNAGQDVVSEYVQQGTGGAIITDIRHDFDELGRVWQQTVLDDPDTPNNARDRITAITFNVAGHEAGKKVTDTLVGNEERTWAYTCLDHLQTMTEKLANSTNAVTTYETDERGNLTAVVDPVLDRTEHDYDALSRQTETRYFQRIGSNDVLQMTEQTIWTSREQKARQTRLDAGGTAIDQQRWEYDVLGFVSRTARMADPNSTSSASTTVDRVVDMGHDGVGRELERTVYADGLARTTQRGFDEIGRLESITHPVVADFEALSYYANSARLQSRTIEDAIGVRTMTGVFDPFGRLKTEIAEGSVPDIVTSYAHDAAKRRVSMIDPLGFVTQYSYDGIGQMLQVTEDQGGANERIASFAYSQKGDLLTVTADDGEGLQVTTHTYDRAGRRLTTVHPDGSDMLFTYDAAGRTVTRQAEDDFITFFSHNWRGLVVQKRQSNSGGPVLEEFTYDPLGRMTAASVGPLASAAYKSTYLYGDGASSPAFVDEPLLETQVVNGVSKTLTHSYNTAADRTGLVYPSGANTTLSFERDAYGQVTAIDRGAERLVNYAYAARYPTSRQVRTTFGPSERWVELVWDRPDQLRRPSGITNCLRIGSTEGAGGTLIGRVSYVNVFDAAGNLDTQTTTGHPITSENGALDHSYDRLHRLTASDYPDTSNDESWALDELSNWTSHTDRDGATQTYTDNNLNQYTAISGQTAAPLHDAKGNLLRNERGYGFTYDFENRLTRVFSDNAPSNGQYDAGEPVHAEYVVDALGRRIQATVAGQTSYRYYDRDDVLLAEFPSTSPNTPSVIFIKGETATDEKILAIDASGNESYYLLKDLDTVAAVVDPSGAYLEAYAYSGYGLPTTVSFIAPCVRGDLNGDGYIDGDDIQVFENVLLGNDTDPNHICAADFDGDDVVDMADVPEFTVCLVYQLCPPGPPAATFQNPFLFTGQRLDRLDADDLLIYDYKARTFDPLHGRFQQRDPLDFADRYNLYEYVGSMPTARLDPSGEFSLPNITLSMAIRSGLQALNYYSVISQVRDVAYQLQSGVGVRAVLTGLIVDAVLDRVGGKVFDAAFSALGKLTEVGFKAIRRSPFDCCFVAGTLVDTPNGPIPIEQISPGDLVLSRNDHEPHGPLVYVPVTEVHERFAPVVLRITVENGETLGITPEHVVWSTSRGWVFAGDLELGEAFSGRDGCQLGILAIKSDVIPQHTWNLRVDVTRTFFAGGLWVHNQSCLRRLFDKHHVFSKFLGGDASGNLVGLPPNLHKAFHKDLLAALRQRGLKRPGHGKTTDWVNLIAKPGNTEKMVDALFEVSQKYDQTLGGDVISTALLDQMIKQGTKY